MICRSFLYNERDAFAAIFTPFVAFAAETTDASFAESRANWTRNYSAFTCVIA
jgi:hypothetical protein